MTAPLHIKITYSELPAILLAALIGSNRGSAVF
jgi:hypothetical protein